MSLAAHADGHPSLMEQLETAIKMLLDGEKLQSVICSSGGDEETEGRVRRRGEELVAPTHKPELRFKQK